MTAGSWTDHGGTWTPGVDEVTGSRLSGGAKYLHATSIADVSYSVEAMFHMDQAPPAAYSWTAVVFAWTESAGNVYAYECAYEGAKKKDAPFPAPSPLVRRTRKHGVRPGGRPLHKWETNPWNSVALPEPWRSLPSA